MLKKAILTVGAPGSGKSTWAEAFVDAHPEWALLECDALREIVSRETGKGLHDPEVSAEAWARWEAKLVTLLALEAPILCSDTNVDRGFREALVTRLQRCGYEVQLELFFPDREELQARNRRRQGERRIPEAIVNSYHEALAAQVEEGVFAQGRVAVHS